MPKILRARLPKALFAHLLIRAKERDITADDFRPMLVWLDINPTVPDGPWFKRFPAFILCGEGELVKTFLLPGQAPVGSEVS